MSAVEILIGDSPLKKRRGPVEGSLVDIDGEPFYRVSNYDAMPPFFMSLVSDSDLWLFISSNGALTAGRRDPDHALFPYYNDDRIHDSQDQTGSKTLIRAARRGATRLWEPFSPRCEGIYGISRTLSKSVHGNKIIFEEHNLDIGLVFSYSWSMSGRFGFVRRAVLANVSAEPVEIELLDGIQNVMPAGLTRRFQLEYSTLADGYRECELEPETGMGLFKLSSIPTDRAEPNEALRANVVWLAGLRADRRLLSAAQLEVFRGGSQVERETVARGRRGSYFVSAGFELPAGASRQWLLVADVGRDSVEVRALIDLLKSNGDLSAEIAEDADRCAETLRKIAAKADGLQATRDRIGACRHFTNVMYNLMRGGVPENGYVIRTRDFASFAVTISRKTADRHADFLRSLPESVGHSRLLELCRSIGDPDLERISREYLPLTFSRRHGDPSRPWNTFTIDVKDAHGKKILGYEGNWRDIFQNWEALALSYPGYIESMIFKFLNASTADGYNPMRITREGFDWELINPHDAWSFIGYWGDHQVVYLLRLLEESARYHPGTLGEFLDRRLFVYANIPYRIKPYRELLENPRNTIDFDAALHAEIMKRYRRMGADGKLVLDAGGGPHRASLAEKLLATVLAKLANFIPEAGIWMNTQRPEWNDANNALVGYGVSMVTLYYLRRFVRFCGGLFTGSRPEGIEIAAEIAVFFRAASSVLTKHVPAEDSPVSDRERKAVLDGLGRAGSDYRSGIYRHGFSGRRSAVSAEELRLFWETVLVHLEHSIRSNRRDDGLYHSYNLMKADGKGISIRRLPEMLEGQVAVLGSGALGLEESAGLLDSLRASRLYRADQNSYILYPDRRLPGFLEKNNIPPDAVARSPLFSEMIGKGDRRIVVVDGQGGAHFNASLRNEEALLSALRGLESGEYAEKARAEEDALVELYEGVFDHRSFTGRSGTFYKYEGLGCVYWHMVSKLRLAVVEILAACRGTRGDSSSWNRLEERYREIVEGIGVHKSPEAHGAIPIDPYSHTPGFAGAQQPGMTGQVKEDIVSRFAELGAGVEGGRLGFDPRLVPRGELLDSPAELRFYDERGCEKRRTIQAGALAFTICQVPVVLHAGGPARIEVMKADGRRESIEGLLLDEERSGAVFSRAGSISGLDVFLDFNEVDAPARKR